MAREDILTRQFLRFACVGVLGFFVDAGMLKIAVAALHMNLYMGRVLSFFIAATSAWALNRNFAFRQAASAARFPEWLRYMVSNVLGGSVNVAAYALLVHESAIARATPTLAVAFGSIAGMLVNFCLMKIFVFRGRRGAAAAPVDQAG